MTPSRSTRNDEGPKHFPQVVRHDPRVQHRRPGLCGLHLAVALPGRRQRVQRVSSLQARVRGLKRLTWSAESGPRIVAGAMRLCMGRTGSI